MSQRVKHFLLALLCISAIGPAAYLPRLSAHSPTFSAPSPTHQHAPGLPDLVRLSPLAGVTVKTKDAGASATKWKTRASAASGDYTTGVQNAGGDWEARAAASNDTYKQAVTEAASKDRFLKGVQGKAAKYTKNATTLGPQRFQAGVANAQDGYAQAMGPVLQTIASVNLPPRGVKGTNQGRSDAMAVALRKMKVGS